MRAKRFFKYLILGALISCIPLASQFVTAFYECLVAFIVHGGPLSYESLMDLITNTVLALSSALVIGGGLIYAFGKRGSALENLHYRRIPYEIIVPCVILGLTLSSAFDFSYLSPAAAEQGSAYMEALGSSPLSILDIVLLGPIAEELFYRGFALNEMRKGMPAVPAILICALLFGLGHADGGILYVVDAGAMGVVLGLIAVKTDSIIPGTIAHIANNALAMVLTGIEVDTLGAVIINVAALAVTAAAIVWIWRTVNRERACGVTPPGTPPQPQG